MTCTHAAAGGSSVPGGRAAPAVARTRVALGVAVSLVVLAAACALSLMIGSRVISPENVVGAVLGSVDGETGQIVRELRIPRTVAAVVTGIALGVAGAIIQALTRNPLGDPGILGVSSGATAGITVGVVFFGTQSPLEDVTFAFVGAAVITIAVTIIGTTSTTIDPVRLTLAGVAVAAVLSGLSTALRLLDPTAFNRLRGWDAGSFVERGWDVLIPAAPFVVAGLVLAAWIARPLNALGLGTDLASSLGAHVSRTRVLSIVAVTLLAGTATAIAGPIGFIGLMAPHAARWITGPDERLVFTLSAMIAPTTILIADILGRVVLFPGEVGAGIVAAFIGAPALIALIRRSRVTAL